jgi:hypothetical protein
MFIHLIINLQITIETIFLLMSKYVFYESIIFLSYNLTFSPKIINHNVYHLLIFLFN